MRIAIINRTGGGISGGYRRYLEKLISGISRDEAVTAILCAAPQSINCKSWLPPDPKVEYIECEPFRFLRHAPSPELKSSLDAFKPDVVFVPTERFLKYEAAPVVCMIQNMAPLVPSGKYRLTERLRMLAQKYEAWLAVRNSAHIIAMSAFVKDFLTGKWQISPGKISLVYFGAPADISERVKPAGIPSEWAGRFLFSSGSLEPYRGLEDLISAAGLLRKQNIDVKIVIAGTGRSSVAYYKKALMELAAANSVQDNILWLGQIPAPELNWCYANCSAFVMTSRVEALAVIILEALAHKCICLSADNPPFPEAFGDSAVYYRSGNPDELAGRISAILAADEAWRGEMRARAGEMIKRFSWKNTVSGTLGVFKRVTKAGSI